MKITEEDRMRTTTKNKEVTVGMCSSCVIKSGNWACLPIKPEKYAEHLDVRPTGRNHSKNLQFLHKLTLSPPHPKSLSEDQEHADHSAVSCSYLPHQKQELGNRPV